ncbi:MAG TPA: chemotaxis protein CheW [Polyangiaceae bacterium]|jgi:purine-binding chemotaxis protein CheW|nr:chemotaxis protein CheW [Polyangiaceae bacterium]
MQEQERQRWLVVEAGMHRVALSLSGLRETMRPLPIEPVRGAPGFVLGLAVIRGAALPVVDLGAVLGRTGDAATFTRFISLEHDGRAAALAVEAVEGFVTLERREFSALPPLLTHAAGDAVEALTLHDRALVWVLSASRLLPQVVPASGTSEANP